MSEEYSFDTEDFVLTKGKEYDFPVVNASRSPKGSTIHEGSEPQSDSELTHDAYNKSKLDKAEMKRLKWNEYMRNYSAKKRKEREERMHKVMISINGKSKLYDEVVINNILIDSFNLFIQILNTNNVLNDSTLICAVNGCNDDIEKLYNLILPIVDKIINPNNYEIRA